MASSKTNTTKTAAAASGAAAHPVPKQEIYTYDSPWTLYGLAWSNNKAEPYRIAVGSCIEEYSNKVQIVEMHGPSDKLVKIAEFDHPYPTTKIKWHPSHEHCKGMIATTGDYLRLWKLHDDDDASAAVAGSDDVGNSSSADAAAETSDATAGGGRSSGKVDLECVLNNSKSNEYCAPLTSMDWNRVDSNIIGTSSIDTTCTIWDINARKPTTQLIAHDKEVYDIAFQQGGKHIFGSVGADGSVRIFDLRSLDCSTIIYENKKQALLRLAWNLNDENYLAVMMNDHTGIVILDIRQPQRPFMSLTGHNGCVNALSWAPHSSCHICTAGDDRQALIWELGGTKTTDSSNEPILAYNANAEINNLEWSCAQKDWVAIVYEKHMQILRV